MAGARAPQDARKFAFSPFAVQRRPPVAVLRLVAAFVFTVAHLAVALVMVTISRRLGTIAHCTMYLPNRPRRGRVGEAVAVSAADHGRVQ
jgi:hypothetical protein